MEEIRRVMHLDAGRWVFAVVGQRGGIHFWCCSDRTNLGGVEQHSRKAPDWADGSGPSDEKCWLLNGPCWHDGSSLYAEEVYSPIFDRCNTDGDFEPLWKRLEQEYARRFVDVPAKQP